VEPIVIHRGFITVERVNSFKLLCLWLDNNLKWETNTWAIVGRSRKYPYPHGGNFRCLKGEGGKMSPKGGEEKCLRVSEGGGGGGEECGYVCLKV
jgi:hypothetical protein